MSRSNITCVIYFHPSDRKLAKRLESILDVATTGKITCCLQSSICSQLVQTATFANCTLALITTQLFVDKVSLQKTKDVFSRYVRLGRVAQFIPILTNIENSVVENNPDFTFLESVFKIRARWDEQDFRDDLLEAICSALSVTFGSTEKLPKLCQSIGTQADLSCTDVSPRELDQMAPPATTQNTDTCLKYLPAANETQMHDAEKMSGESNASNLYVEGVRAPIPCSEVTSTLRNSCPELCLIGRGSTSVVSHCVHALPDKQQIQAVKKILRSSPVTLKCFLRVTAFGKLRSPWLLPLLDVVHNLSMLQIITPFMNQGSLESHLQRPMLETDFALSREQRVIVLYQVSGAIRFLHDRNIAHCGVCPSTILLDGYYNARLSDYDRATHINASIGAESEFNPSLFTRVGYRDPCDERREDAGEAKRLSDDVLSFGVTALQTLKWNSEIERTLRNRIYRDMTLFERLLNENQELPSGDDLSKDERFIDRSVWPDDKVTEEITRIVITCLKPTSGRPSASDLMESMDSVIIRNELPHINFPEEKCVYCKDGDLCREIQLRSSKCSQSCTFLKACRSCMIGFVSCRCPVHGAAICPPVGGDQACALIMHGRDPKDTDFEITCKNDATLITEVVNHPKIIGIPVANTFFIDNTCTETQFDAILQRIAQFDFLLIYYSGHGISTSETAAKLDISTNQGFQLNIDRLQQRLRSVSNLQCSRIFVIMDCCSAAEVTLFPRSASGSNAIETDWHIQWLSCRRKEDSHVDADDRHSTFTRYILCALTGAMECPNGTPDCRTCSSYKDSCRRSERSVVFVDLSMYVEEHMKERPRDGLEDRQNPVVDIRGNSKQIIANFSEAPLYTFHFQTPDSHLQTCTVGLLGSDMEDILNRIWRHLKQWLPNNVDYKHLRLRGWLGTCEVTLNTVKDIIQANADDQNALFVTVESCRQE